MAYLGNPTRTMAVLEKHGFHTQKKFGQNFLVDPNILEEIIAAAEITKDDFVLEIGPGIGNLTQYLCESARKVVAVEIDTKLIPVLTDTLKEYDNVSIVNQDILKLDLADLVEKENAGKPIKVVANLPYYITTPILMELLESHIPMESVTVMVQKEVAERMQVGPGTKDYGALSLAIQYYTVPKIICEVPPSCFIPRPNVSSAVIQLTCHREPPVKIHNEAFLFQVIRASFNQRRKTLVNGLNNSPTIPVPKEVILRTIEELGYSPTIRGEILSLEEFARLSDALGLYLEKDKR